MIKLFLGEVVENFKINFSPRRKCLQKISPFTKSLRENWVEFLKLYTSKNFERHKIIADTCNFKSNMKRAIIIEKKKLLDLCKTCEQQPKGDSSGLNESRIKNENASPFTFHLPYILESNPHPNLIRTSFC